MPNSSVTGTCIVLHTEVTEVSFCTLSMLICVPIQCCDDFVCFATLNFASF